MENQINPIPEGYHSLTPYLVVDDPNGALEFYKEAFGAKELMSTKTENGDIGHCEMQIGDSRFMFSGFGKLENTTPSLSTSLLIYVDNVDEFFRKAISIGASEIHSVSDQFYGDRMGTLRDPFGHYWHIGTHVEDVSPEEMEKRAQEKWKH